MNLTEIENINLNYVVVHTKHTKFFTKTFDACSYWIG